MRHSSLCYLIHGMIRIWVLFAWLQLLVDELSVVTRLYRHILKQNTKLQRLELCTLNRPLPHPCKN